MKYSIMRLLIFVFSVLVIMLGSYLYSVYPGLEIALWLVSPIIAGLVSLAFTNTIDAEVQERVNKILEEAEATKENDDEQIPE